MDPTLRLRIATRIHFALLRHYDEDVPVDSLLAGDGEGREALWVCEASKNEELLGLFRQLGHQERAREPLIPPRPRHAPQVGVEAALAAVRGVDLLPELAPVAALPAPQRPALPAPRTARVGGMSVPPAAWAAESVPPAEPVPVPSFMQPQPSATEWLNPANWLRRTATAS